MPSTENDAPDDPQAIALLDQYLQELHAGRQPDRDRLLAEHPELAELVGCIESLHRLAPPKNASAAGSSALTMDAAVLPVVQDSEPPAEFGKFELLGEIGRGGMGVVYKARQKDLDREVAIKMILASSLASPDQVQRFHAEARAAARLQHPHIVQIHEAGQIHGQHFFAMEFVDGPSLADLLQHGPLPPDAAARLTAAVARAVHHLHEHGIIHRDLKPSNILLQKLETGNEKLETMASESPVSSFRFLASGFSPKITDFGLAKMLAGGSEVTGTGAILGTPSYMAPEQAAGRQAEVTPRSDVYSLGAVLYELLTGRPPFREESPLDTLVQVLESEPTAPGQLNPRVPRELDVICLKCLEKAPEDRYRSARALAEDLERFLKGEAVEARPHGLWQRLRRWSRREPALASRLAALAASTAVVQAHYHLDPDVTFAYHLKIMGVLVVWIATSFAFQALLRRDRWLQLARIAWAGADVALFTIIVNLSGAPAPLLVGYPVLVAASGLWFRVSLVWFTTAVSIAAYAALVLAHWLESGPPLHLHIIYLVALAVLGYVVAYQVQRVRALSRYYEHRLE